MLRLVLVVFAAILAPLSVAQQPAPSFAERVEADWISQIEPRSPTSTADDALGACDGVKDGKWGFHTGNADKPWWQVDLGTVEPLSRIVVYNRCDGGCLARANGMALLLSDDGAQWTEVFRHSGEPFGGLLDGRPLSVDLAGRSARFVRLQLPVTGFLHLDEVEVYGAADPERNLALWAQAEQCSTSQWSVKHRRPGVVALNYPLEETLARGRRLAQMLADMGVDVRGAIAELDSVAATGQAEGADRRALFLRARWTIRGLAFRNPLLDFDRLVLVKRAPGTFSHMSDQNYGWWSRPGGGVFVLQGLRGEEPRLTNLTSGFPEGSFMSPELSFDGTRILFAYCRYYPDLSSRPDKTDKQRMPEDGYYHIFEIGVDGSGLRQLTRGPYDDFDARYLPDGGIVFLSTRRGQTVQCSPSATLKTLGGALPDSYVRCGGDNYRPVAVYTLHRMNREGGDVRALSPFENFEWSPSVAADGRIIYARWDYVDRDNMPYMSLWSTNPDGTNPRLVYGNFTRNPHCIFEARSVPGSHKLLFTASAHHCITGGSVVLLDPAADTEGLGVLAKLTPEVCYPEVEGWPQTYYVTPYPLSEDFYLTAWSNVALNGQGSGNAPNATGLYLADSAGNLELIYRDPEISSMSPLPLRPRPAPPQVAHGGPADSPGEGRFVLQNVYAGLTGVPAGAVKALRIVGVPPKTQPQMNSPRLGVTGDDPGKYVLGTVPVEADGSAHFRAPAGASVFFQALDQDGMALQTMRTLTYLQAGQTLSCAGCHEPRASTPTNARCEAVGRRASAIAPGPEGSWPLHFDTLVRPVLQKHCIGCHAPGGNEKAARLDLSGDGAYDALIGYGSPSLRDQVWAAYRAGKSEPGTGGARDSKLLAMLLDGHSEVALAADDVDRLVTWMDTYSQFRGAFSAEQEAQLAALRASLGDMLAQ